MPWALSKAAPIPLPPRRLSQRDSLGATVIESVKKQLERAVRLRAKSDFRTQDHHLPFPHRRLGDRRSAVEILLTPGPAAVQHVCAGEPPDCGRALQPCIRLQAKHGTVIVENVDLLRHAVSKRMRIVDI